MTDTVTHSIGGEAVGSEESGESLNPSKTGEVVARYPKAGRGEVDAAVSAARSAFPDWSEASRKVRSDVLDRAGTLVMARAKELGALLSREEGKTLAEGTGEVMRAGRILKYFAGERCVGTGRRWNRRGRGSTPQPTASRSACMA